VREIRQGERGAWAIYADADGQLTRVDADYCVCTTDHQMPMPSPATHPYKEEKNTKRWG